MCRIKEENFRQMKPEALKPWGWKELTMFPEDQGDSDMGVKREWCKTDGQAGTRSHCTLQAKVESLDLLQELGNHWKALGKGKIWPSLGQKKKKVRKSSSSKEGKLDGVKSGPQSWSQSFNLHFGKYKCFKRVQI